ncbi:MAG: response regulator [Planctomycetota bacterium]|jgi:DNA-binding NarL/FixJ family response regulator
MNGTDTKKAKLARGESGVHADSPEKTTILIANGRPEMRNKLMQLIRRESELGVCIEADTAGQTLETIESRRIDLAIVDISKANSAGIKLSQEIKLRSPTLPLLTLSISDDRLRERLLSPDADQGHPADRQAGEKIIAAIRYVQSLLRSRLSGFTVLVKI